MGMQRLNSNPKIYDQNILLCHDGPENGHTVAWRKAYLTSLDWL